jgi:glyoxylase I family protein
VQAGGVMQIERIHHIAIICSNYEASKKFYTEILGAEIIQETYRAERQSYKLDLRIGIHDQLELFSFPSPPPRPSYPEACGLRHLALLVADIDAAHRHLTEQNVKPEPVRMDELTGKRFFFFADPDGLPIEMYEK